MMMPKTIISHLCDGRDLTDAQTQAMMRGILSGDWTSAQIAGALIALKIKGETPDEIAAAAAVMRDMATPVELDAATAAAAVDTCGTGGDGAGAFNISTTAAFVVAACGARVAKHGNRAMSGASGSADVLEALGMPMDMPPARIARLISTVGIGFMFAPNHHAAARHAAPARRELGIRTLFNLLGPLANPAGARRQVVGVFAAELLTPYAEVLGKLGATRAMVVHSNGLDEVSVCDETDIAEWRDGAVTRWVVAPDDVGLARAEREALQVGSVDESKARLLAVLAGEAGAGRDVVVMNAAAALMVADLADDFAAGVRRAQEAIDSGAAQRKLDDFIAAARAP